MASTKYNLNELITPYYPEIAETNMGELLGYWDETFVNEICEANGFDNRFHELKRKLYKAQIDLGSIRDLRLRGELSDEELAEKMHLLGFNDSDIKLLKILFVKIPSVSESIIAHFRGKITDQELKEIAEKNGIDDKFLDIIITANRQLLGFADIKSIYFREGKDESWLNTQLDKLGLDEDSREDIKKIMPFYPGVGDLVRFAVREVYYPDYVSKYGLADEYPPEYEEAAKKAGLPPEQAKNYWMAHWILPSILQGYEMLHRGVIGSEELGDLFKAVDIMPYWREKLEAISYRVFTRVDVRRMYRDGVLDEAGVLKSYMDLGYDAEKAKIFADFIKFFYDQRLQAKKEGNSSYTQFYKLIMNSLYGKFGQLMGEWETCGKCDPKEVKYWRESSSSDPKIYHYRKINGLIQRYEKKREAFHSFCAVASHVTGYARVKMWQLMEKADRDNVYYCDTDSLFVNSLGYENLKSELSSNEIGKLKIENKATSLKLLGCKQYIFGSKKKHKGRKNDAIKLSDNVYKQTQWSTLKTLIQNENLKDYRVTEVVKHFTGKYNKGYLQNDGTVTPLIL
ncbi:hypothetical protein ES708_25545 [subsurface metagenome]